MAFIRDLFRWGGFFPTDHALVISAPAIEGTQVVCGTELDRLATEVGKLSSEVHKYSLGELEKIFSDFQELKQRRALLVRPLEDRVIVQIESDKVEYIDQELSRIQTKISETNAHKEHVLAKLTKLRDAILARADVSEDGPFRTYGRKPAVDALTERLDTDLETDLSLEMRDTLIGIFKKIIKEFGDKNSSLLDSIRESLSGVGESIPDLKRVVELLKTDSPEYKITKLVIGLLSEVAKHSDSNKMPASTLALCMMENFFTSFFGPTQSIEAMIEHYGEIFA